MSEQPAAYGGERPAVQSPERIVMRALEARIATLEAALLRTWCQVEGDRMTLFCGVCEERWAGSQRTFEHAPDCLMVEILARHANGSD